MYRPMSSRRTLEATWAALPAIACAALAAAARPADVRASDEWTAPTVLAPALGRPVFVPPGGTFEALIAGSTLAPAAGTLEFALVRSRSPEARYPLRPVGDARAAVRDARPLQLTVDASVPLGTYDLHVEQSGIAQRIPHCVAVARVGSNLRIVQLSDMHVGDPAAPDFDPLLVHDVNLLAPDVLLCTGNYLDASHPDPAAGWTRLRAFLSLFDAPAILACGDQDDPAHYGKTAAASPVGLLPVGRHRVLVLLEHDRAPIEKDPEQLRWAEGVLIGREPAGRRPGTPFDGLTLVLCHARSPGVLRYWRAQGRLSQIIRQGRVGVWFAGGADDWDGRSDHDLIGAAAPLVFVRTAQSSPAQRGEATGVSHFRLLEIHADRVWQARETPGAAPPPSLAVGRLRVALDGANDGSATRLAATVINPFGFRLDNMALTVRLRKSSAQRPICVGGRMEQVVDLGQQWECRVRFDLPDRGLIRIDVAPAPAEPPRDLRITIEAPARLRLAPAATVPATQRSGASAAPAAIVIENTGPNERIVRPIIRLDGRTLALEGSEPAPRHEPALRILAGQRIRCPLDLAAAAPRPGRRELQVWLDTGTDGPWTPVCWPIEVEP